MYTQPPKRNDQGFLTLMIYFLVGLLIPTILFSLFIIVFQVLHINKIYPGVSIAGVPVSNLTLEEATKKLSYEFTYPTDGKIIFKYENETWFATPEQLGLHIDTQATITQAYLIGRTGNIFQKIGQQFNAMFRGVLLSPSFTIDQNESLMVINNIKDAIELPVKEPTISIESGRVVVTEGQHGLSIDLENLLAELTLQFQSLQDGIIEINTTEIYPKIQNLDEISEKANRILSEPLLITINTNNGGTDYWRIDPDTLASVISFPVLYENDKPYFEIEFDSQYIKQFLYDLEEQVNIPESSTRFIFNDETRLLEIIQPAVIGRRLDIDTSLYEIRTNLLDGNHEVSLKFNYVTPPITDDFNGTDLGITELVNTETSFFYGSSPERVQNITTAAKQFHGLLIPPGETFSMVEALGDISLDNGYAEALIIYGDETIKGVGGGVCQVSTTLFRNAFISGFPIIERHAHAYRVYYYEKIAGNRIDPNLAGLDATVYAPYVDLKFTNDTPYWLLMETYVNPTYSSLIWKFYSTRDGRVVDWDTSGLQNITEPPDPLYRENAELAQGEIKQVDWEAEGADVTVNRTVYLNGSITHEDTFVTNYEPWQAIYEYGPGTEDMPPEDSDNN